MDPYEQSYEHLQTATQKDYGGSGGVPMPKQVGAADRLNAAQNRLHEAIDMLEARIVPILGSEAPVSEIAPDDPDPGTFIHNAALTTDMQANRIQRIIKRIEL